MTTPSPFEMENIASFSSRLTEEKRVFQATELLSHLASHEALNDAPKPEGPNPKSSSHNNSENNNPENNNPEKTQIATQYPVSDDSADDSSKNSPENFFQKQNPSEKLFDKTSPFNESINQSKLNKSRSSPKLSSPKGSVGRRNGCSVMNLSYKRYRPITSSASRMNTIIPKHVMGVITIGSSLYELCIATNNRGFMQKLGKAHKNLLGKADELTGFASNDTAADMRDKDIGFLEEATSFLGGTTATCEAVGRGRNG